MRRQGDVFPLSTLTLAQTKMPSRRKMLRSMRKPSQPGAPIGTAVFIFTVIVVLAVIAALIVKKLRDMLKASGPKLGLFNELVDAHGLNRDEQKALKRLVRREKLSIPAKVFVQPRHLKAYAGTHPVYRELLERIFSR